MCSKLALLRPVEQHVDVNLRTRILIFTRLCQVHLPLFDICFKMSFLGDLVSSIGGDKAPPPPLKLPPRSAVLKPAQQAASSTAQGQPVVKPTYKGTIGTSSLSQSSSTLKRKADEALSEETVRILRPDRPRIHSNTAAQKALKINPVDIKQSESKSATASPISQSGSTAQKPTPKALSKGSYAELMARAKEAQQNRAPSQVGVIKHHATEKLKPMKLADRRKEEQERLKNGRSGLSSRSTSTKDVRQRSASPAKRSESSKAPKIAKPPLHGPALPPKPAYKGTMGMSSKHPKEARQAKKSKYDDYLGTDEEDEAGLEDDSPGDYDNASDASSVMEGGFDDWEREERIALQAAKRDDAEELALEARLKREKMEKKQRMAALAAKHSK